MPAPFSSRTFAQAVIVPFDLNIVDTAGLKKIKGIGEKLSLRIIKYRDALGGFISVDQLREVYNLDTILVKTISARCFITNGFTPEKIDLNHSDQKVLAGHPYLSQNEANAIVAYRFQHGNFKTTEDLENIKAIDPKSLQRIIPYLEIK